MPEWVNINPRVVVPRDGEKPFVPMGCLANDSMLITDIESRDGNSGAKFQNGDTLFARITSCLENGKTGFVQFLPDAQAVAFGSTEFIVVLLLLGNMPIVIDEPEAHLDSSLIAKYLANRELLLALEGGEKAFHQREKRYGID